MKKSVPPTWRWAPLPFPVDTKTITDIGSLETQHFTQQHVSIDPIFSNILSSTGGKDTLINVRYRVPYPGLIDDESNRDTTQRMRHDSSTISLDIGTLTHIFSTTFSCQRSQYITAYVTRTFSNNLVRSSSDKGTDQEKNVEKELNSPFGQELSGIDEPSSYWRRPYLFLRAARQYPDSSFGEKMIAFAHRPAYKRILFLRTSRAKNLLTLTCWWRQ